LKLVGLLTGFPNTFIGLTFLAWGNSLSDAFANPALAKMGYAIMAITGCFAG
jgi:Ca2+/Na+ antiporter